MSDEPTLTEEKKPDIGWAIVELMGHRRLAGYLTEAELAGTSFFRIDVPESNGRTAATQYFRGEAVYALTPCTERVARATADFSRPEPVSRWDLRALEAPKADPLPGTCATCGSIEVYEEGAAEGWVCKSCGASDEDE